MEQEENGKDGLYWPDICETEPESGKGVPWAAVAAACVMLAAVLVLGIIAACLQMSSGNPGGENGAAAETTTAAEDLALYREEALAALEEVAAALPPERRRELSGYIENAGKGIREAAQRRTIDATLSATLAYLSTVMGNGTGDTDGSEEAGTVPVRVMSSPDGRKYTPVDYEGDWELCSLEQRRDCLAHSIPVLQDESCTIDKICRRVDGYESLSWTLAGNLYRWCEKEGISATRGEYLVYAEFTRKSLQKFYIELNDRDSTVVLATVKDYGLTWQFSYPEISRKEIYEMAEVQRMNGDPSPE